jgi:preprotein translocase subunit SecG
VETLRTVLLVIFVIDAILLVIAVLLQSGRGGGLAGALGGIGGADSALGVRAASQIEKATGVMAAVFLILALVLGLTAGTQRVPTGDSPVDERGVLETTGTPTTPPAGMGTPVTPPEALTTSPAGTTTTPAADLPDEVEIELPDTDADTGD